MKKMHTVRYLARPWLLGLAASLCTAPLALAIDSPGPADSPGTAEVLAKLHATSQKEIQMAKLAQQHGKSKDVLAFAKALIKDHTAADKKVMALAKKQKLHLPATASLSKEDHAAAMDKSTSFDAHFVQAMLADHKKTVHDLRVVRDNTFDEELKALITELLPTLEKHEATAQKLADKSEL
jgi:putative membrane protein